MSAGLAVDHDPPALHAVAHRDDDKNDDNGNDKDTLCDSNRSDASRAGPVRSISPGSALAAPASASSHKAKTSRRCRFYALKQGCRTGDACPFRHDAPRNESSTTGGLVADKTSTSHGTATSAGRSLPRQAVTPLSTTDPSPDPAKAAPVAVAAFDRPVGPAEAKDPRSFQINQLKRRYGAKEEDVPAASLLRFALAPSDPDFPFDLPSVKCALRVPAGFPDRERPTLKVSNREMERGYQLNVERGFDACWDDLRQKTLLNAMKLLDRRLESLLSAQKAEFITIVANSGSTQHAPTAPSTSPAPSQPTVSKPSVRLDPAATTFAPRQRPSDPPPSFERMEQARSRRGAETRSLEQRLGRDVLFVKEAGGTMYSLPIDARKRTELPSALQSVRSVRLFVPENYDIEPCSIELLGVQGGEAAVRVEAAFAHRARERRDLTLMAHLNNLAQNMHIMAAELPQTTSEPPKIPISTKGPTELQYPKAKLAHASLSEEDPPAKEDIQDTDKDHVKVIQRPPEWDRPRGQQEPDEDSSDDSDGDYDSVDSADITGEEMDPGSGDQDTSSATQARESGVMVSIPGLELYNIELLEIALLSITVKCTRCKETIDVHGVKPADNEKPSANARTMNCRKCSLDHTVSFRADLMHAGSSRAGYLDLDNCEPLDILPSNFLPTCSACSTTHAHPGVVSTRAKSDSLALCRGCHARMLFKLPQVHFLRVGPSVRLAGALPRRPGKQGGPSERARLGIVPGTELPRRGICGHYRKSYRWFRFSCCEKLYPCDRCHDESPEGGSHPQEFANRMVCGWCSREQRYHPEDCSSCRRSVVGRKGHGFWEGGQGTRDPKRMSRKDPRKYKLGRKIRADQQKAKEKNDR